MKSAIKIIIVLIIIALTPLIIGIFQPVDRLIIEKGVVDKMYFFVLGDITNHWEEPQWRQNIDTPEDTCGNTFLPGSPGK